MAWLTKFASWALPIILEWLYKKGKAEIEARLEKAKKDEERGKVNEKNLKRLQECKDAQACIIAARDAYNGVRESTPVSE